MPEKISLCLGVLWVPLLFWVCTEGLSDLMSSVGLGLSSQQSAPEMLSSTSQGF